MTTATKIKWVRIMCDYCAAPIWAPDGTMMELDELPVTDELKQRLSSWEALYDLQGSPNALPFDIAAFSDEGRELAREVKHQLPDWTVVYYDENAAGDKSEKDLRITFEYEIN